MTDLPRAVVAGRSHRLIASRHPTVGVFDDLTDDPEDLRVAFQLEMATNPRLGEAADRLALLYPDELLAGPTASLVMAAFLHTDERGGRFHDRRLGAWYAALELETAIAETVFHNERRLRMSEAGFPNRVQVRELMADLDLELADIRGMAAERPDLYDPDPAHYPVSQAFAAALRWPQSPAPSPRCAGLTYDSVRRARGRNVCLFWPSDVPRPVVQGGQFDYAWDREGRVSVTKATAL
ncbi:MAG: RES family NAD+ phosphorylase [Alphaproteobacteria bacterium]